LQTTERRGYIFEARLGTHCPVDVALAGELVATARANAHVLIDFLPLRLGKRAVQIPREQLEDLFVLS